MVPFTPDTIPQLDDKQIFLSAGRNDPIVPEANTLRLIELFRSSNAVVTPFWHNSGHSLTPGEASAAKEWLSSRSDLE